MSKWIPVTPSDVNAQKSTLEGGVKIEIHVSPYDMPQAVRGNYDREKRRFVITFKYMTPEEKTTSLPEDNGISLCVGARTHRVQSIEVDVDSLGVSTVQLAVEKAADMVKRQINTLLTGGHSRYGQNAVAAKKVIERKRAEIFSDLTALAN